MAMTLDMITNAKRDRPNRVIALGLPKTGKSTLAAQAPNPIILPIKGEEGIDALDVQAFPVAKNFGDVMEMLGELYTGKHDFKTVVIDSISTLEPIIWDETCLVNGKVKSIEAVGGGYGKGFTEALRQWRDLIDGLDALRNERGMGCVLIGHVKAKKFNDPLLDSYDRYSLDIHEKAVKMITKWVDGILFLNHKTAVKKEDVGFQKTKSRAVDVGKGLCKMYTQSRPSHPGGGRGAWGHIPYELDLSWSVLEAELKKASGFVVGA